MLSNKFSGLDTLVLVAYLLATTALGVWLGRNQKSSRDYFVADRSLPWWAVMFSIVASETSALTFISIPGLAYMGDLGFLQVAAGYILGRIVVAFVLLPRYFQGELVTAYTLLETRFGPETRRFTSIVFMVTRAMADSVRVFATAIPVALILGPVLPQRYMMPAAILVLGALTILYTYRGGMRAVVWTELLQAAVYISGGIAAIRLLGKSEPEGWSDILRYAGTSGKLGVISFYTGFDQPHTIFAGLIGGAFLAMASHGADQMIVQRLLASRSLRDAQRAIIGSGLVVFVQFTLFLMVGIGLWQFYGGVKFPSTDLIFPTFIIQAMPHGLLGLIVAAIVAATMSTHSGAINSLAAATTHDIYMPLTQRRADDPATFRAGRLFALAWGIVLTGVCRCGKSIAPPVVAIDSAITTTGMSVGIFAMSGVVFAKPLVAAVPGLHGMLGPFVNVAWPWYVLIGTTITLAVGSLSALARGQPRS